MVSAKRFSMFLLICASILVILAESCSAADFSKADLKKMSTFLSNFTEQSMFDLDAGTIGRDELIRFGVWHNYINNYKSRVARCKVKDCPHGSLVIDAENVAESIKKYFGRDFKDHASVKPDYDFYKEYEAYYDGKLYHFEGADGEAVYLARVKEASENDSGQIIMKGELYRSGDESDILGTFEAAAKPYKYGSKNTWAIISLKTEYGE